MCGCNGFDGYDEEIEETSRGYTDFDGDNDEFDNFFTKRSRARRRLRRKLRKSGLSRKEARRKARSKIPRQKLGKLLKNVVSGKTSEETKRLIKQSGVKPSVAEKLVNDALEENTGGGNDNTKTTTSELGTKENPIPLTQSGGNSGGKKVAIMVGVGAVVLIGGYFAWKSFK